VIEEHRLITNWPCEVKVIKNTILFRDSVLKRALIKCERREVAEAWMHAILDLQSNRPDTQADQSLEQTLV
jgi:hypothetical protein